MVESSKRRKPIKPPEDTAAIRRAIDTAMNSLDDKGRKVGNAKFGVYAFYDYDGEPIYVGQTRESLRTRIRRHLTNQRTDAVAMNVLDPFEVADVEMWPFFELDGRKATDSTVRATLNAAEYTVFQAVLDSSKFAAVLNEKAIAPRDVVALPASSKHRIVPDELYNLRKHPDIRIARRASTIASLARVISERQVQVGLRQTLVTQARRLEWLASERFAEAGGQAAVEVKTADDDVK